MYKIYCYSSIILCLILIFLSLPIKSLAQQQQGDKQIVKSIKYENMIKVIGTIRATGNERGASFMNAKILYNDSLIQRFSTGLEGEFGLLIDTVFYTPESIWIYIPQIEHKVKFLSFMKNRIIELDSANSDKLGLYEPPMILKKPIMNTGCN